ncbi:hypothetical protein F8S13_11595 [Chloroflexia bacterium SDU3-3]|nr:hypothetical protein F8S13_11595 [Chloroflexia bacterium SDU3-3]
MSTTVFLRSAARVHVPEPFQDGLLLDLFNDPNESTITANLERIVEMVGVPPQSAIDLALFASAIYVADKKTLRRLSSDRWTRDFRFMAPVAEPGRWDTATSAFCETLTFLTGDRWSLTWRDEPTRIWRVQEIGCAAYDAVCLFSGGLDSLAGAIDLLEHPSNPRVLLLGHYDSTLTPHVQTDLAEHLITTYGKDRVGLLQLMVRPATFKHQERPLPTWRETTTRSRSIVFLGLALATAAALGPKVPVYVPENGFIALNLPLTNARLGSCSTRTTHPYFLARLRAALGILGITNPIYNPYEHLTKGELLAKSQNFALLCNLAHHSVSCAHPEAGRYEGTPYGNCGYCFPCLIRRASLHAIGNDDPSEYARDICTDEELFAGHSTRGRDARSVFIALQRWHPGIPPHTFVPLLAGPLPTGADRRAYLRVAEQGLAELRIFFQERASGAIRRIASLDHEEH